MFWPVGFGISIFLGCLEEYARFRFLRRIEIFGFWFFVTVSRDVLISWLVGFGLFCFLGIVSRNRVISLV